jgi:hypothetical protein
MLRTLLILAAAGAVAAPRAAAQAHPDFSGTWKINVTKSDPMGGRPGGQAPDMSQLTLTVTQTGDSVVIFQTGLGPDRTLVHYLDGRESTNAGPRGTMRSTSHWEGATLVTEGTVTANTQMGEMQFTTREVRELSADGKTLTVNTTTETPRGTMTRKAVFEKQ